FAVPRKKSNFTELRLLGEAVAEDRLRSRRPLAASRSASPGFYVQSGSGASARLTRRPRPAMPPRRTGEARLQRRLAAVEEAGVADGAGAEAGDAVDVAVDLLQRRVVAGVALGDGIPGVDAAAHAATVAAESGDADRSLERRVAEVVRRHRAGGQR